MCLCSRKTRFTRTVTGSPPGGGLAAALGCTRGLGTRASASHLSRRKLLGLPWGAGRGGGCWVSRCWHRSWGGRAGGSCEHTACSHLQPLTSFQREKQAFTPRPASSGRLPLSKLSLNFLRLLRQVPLIHLLSISQNCYQFSFYLLCSYEFVTLFPLYGHFGRVSGDANTSCMFCSPCLTKVLLGSFHTKAMLMKAMGRVRSGEGSISKERKTKWERRQDRRQKV